MKAHEIKLVYEGRVTQQITKHNYLVTQPKDIARVVREAFHIATTGRPGPVLVDITKDAQIAQIDDGALTGPGGRRVPLDQIDRVSILGPDKYLAKQLNNKIAQYKALDGIVPLAEHRVCENWTCLLQITEFHLFELAYGRWFGRPPRDDELEECFAHSGDRPCLDS